VTLSAVECGNSTHWEANNATVTDLKQPDWRAACQEAILEANPEKLAQRVHTAETAIFLRLSQIRISSDGNKEGQAMREALDGLASLKVTGAR
jgi:hypothetical protein